MKLTVVHLEGSKQGQTEYVPGPVIAIGRDPASNQLAFDPFKDLDVSTNHASVTFQGDQVLLQDLGSRNGTFLNGARVNGAVPLPNDSIVQFGEKGPKVKLTYVFHGGPGKKTQMIQDLSSKLGEAEEAQKKAALEQKAAKSRSTKIGVCLFLLVLMGLGIYAIVSKIQAGKKLQEDVATLKADLGGVRTKSEGLGASSEAAAKAEWDAALAALAAAEEAEKAEDWATAKTKYDEATRKFKDAGESATVAQLNKFKTQAADAEKMKADAEKARQADQAAAAEAIEKARLAEEQRIADLLKRLNDANALKDNLRALEGSTNPDELKGAVAALEKAIAENPNDAALKEQLEKFKASLSRAENVGELLVKAASEAKAKVVGIRTRVYAIPAGQRPDTTRIRIPVAETHGTGFFASAAGHIVTAKEVVEPHHFSPEAMALEIKLTEKGMQILTDLEVLTSTAGVYTSTYASPKVAVTRRFNDSIGSEQSVTIPFDNKQVEVKVRLHRRDESDVVILKVEGLTEQPFIPLGAAEAAPGLPIVLLGTQLGGEGLEANQVGLFLFQGKVANQGRKADLDAPSYRSWIGGPVLDADGKVVGLLIGEGTEKSKSIAPTVFKGELE